VTLWIQYVFSWRSVPELTNAAQTAARNAGPSAALLDKVRALDNLPRIGALKTLDLRGNELRVRPRATIGELFC